MIAFIILMIINVFIFTQTGVKTPVENGKKWTVFGTMGCGWTRKQLDYMKKNGKPHEFVDCNESGCDGVEAFPTLVSPDGEKTVGYKEV